MPRVGCNLHRVCVKKQLARTDNEGFAILCRATDGFQSGIPPRIAVAGRLIEHSQEAIVDHVTTPHFVHKWSMETLFNELFLTRKVKQTGKGLRMLNHHNFNGIVPVGNALRDMENTEYGWECESTIDGAMLLATTKGSRPFLWKTRIDSSWRVGVVHDNRTNTRKHRSKPGTDSGDVAVFCNCPSVTFRSVVLDRPAPSEVAGSVHYVGRVCGVHVPQLPSTIGQLQLLIRTHPIWPQDRNRKQ